MVHLGASKSSTRHLGVHMSIHELWLDVVHALSGCYQIWEIQRLGALTSILFAALPFCKGPLQLTTVDVHTAQALGKAQAKHCRAHQVIKANTEEKNTDDLT